MPTGGGAYGGARTASGPANGGRPGAPLTGPRITSMKLNAHTSIARVVETLRSFRTGISSFVRARMLARQRRIEQEKEFYRKLEAYCRANNLSPICEDDWKTAAYAKDR